MQPLWLDFLELVKQGQDARARTVEIIEHTLNAMKVSVMREEPGKHPLAFSK